VRERSTAVYAVFDASVFVRAIVPLEASALGWVQRAIGREVSVSVPNLVFAEVGNALCAYARETTITLDGALRRLAFVVRMPLEIRELENLVGPAVGVATSRGLTVYDACYAVLAEADDAVLVTADRGLAAAVAQAELI
jgi:predicted nucleic acid-binding protein